MERLTNQINAYDSRGARYKILVYRGYDQSLDGTTIVGDVTTLRLVNGQLVQRISKGEYVVVETGMRLCSDAPDAP